MFGFFNGKKNLVPSSESHLIEAIQGDGSLRSSEFVFVKRDGQVNFLDEVTDVTWGKYAEALRRVLDASDLKDELKQIEFIEDFEDSGECKTDVIDGNLVITIRVASRKLCFINGRFIHPFNEERCKECCDILAHELVHGKDAANIAREYGAKELTDIKAHYISLLAWSVLGEYSACRETAERYGAFESVEQINKQLSFVPGHLIWILTDQSRLHRPIYLINRFYYALATRCAFADVSGNVQEHLSVSENFNNRDKIMHLIKETRRLLADTYKKQPLTRKEYESLGRSLVALLLIELCGLEEAKVNWAIEKFIILQAENRGSIQPPQST